MIKRIIAEQERLFDNYGECTLLVETKKNEHTNAKENKYTINLKVNNKQLRFEMNSNYPFQCPKLYINDKAYREMLKFPDDFTRNLIKDKGIECLCCHTKLCDDKWKPCVRLNDLVIEFLNVQEILVPILQKKYLYKVNDYYQQILPNELIEKICDFF